MSHEPTHSAEHMAPPAAQSEDIIHFGKVIMVGVGAAVIFTSASIFAYHLMRNDQAQIAPGGETLPKELGQNQLGIVEQAPFDVTRAVEDYRKDKLERLETWGWVDRANGIVHMPIERAMEDIVARQGRKK